MLIKKKLLELPIPEYPQSVKVKGREVVVQAAVDDGIYQLAMWRERQLVSRIFSDGKNAVKYNVETDRWYSGVLDERIAHRETDESKEITEKFFDIYCYGSVSTINSIRRSIASERRERTKLKRHNQMVERIRSFPADPEDLEQYCERHVFQKKFALLKKGESKRTKEECKCLVCGKNFAYEGRLKHKAYLKCPSCASEVQLIAERYIHTARERAAITVLFKNDKGDILMRQEYIERRFDTEGKPVYETDPFYWRIDQGDGKVYRYYYGFVSYRGCYDYREDHYGNKEKRAFVYDVGLNQIIPAEVDLERLHEAGVVHLSSLIYRIQDTETAKTLYKLGLYQLAESWEIESEAKKIQKSFEDELGVNVKYYPIMKSLNVSPATVRWMKTARIHLHDEQIKKIHELTENPGYRLGGELQEMRQYMGMERIINYLYKQHQLRPKTDTSTLITWYNDYRSMTDQLNGQMLDNRKLDMKKSAFSMPRDIKVAHDGVLAKLDVIKDRSKDIIIRKIGRRWSEKRSFTYKGLTVVYPMSIEDFVAEGTALRHCVGNNTTYRNGQANGNMLTVFIRRVEAPDKPYQTATFYPKENYRLKETYGMNHKVATKEIREFIEVYQEFMRAAAGMTAA